MTKQRQTQQWFEKLAPAELVTLNSWMHDKDTSYKEIAQMYNVTQPEISKYAARMGLAKRSAGGRRTSLLPVSKSARPTTLSVVERQLTEEVARMEEMKKRIAELQSKKAALQVRFEWDDADVLVYGFGTHVVRATPAECAQWLNMEGPRRLREFMATRRS